MAIVAGSLHSGWLGVQLSCRSHIGLHEAAALPVLPGRTIASNAHLHRQSSVEKKTRCFQRLEKGGKRKRNAKGKLRRPDGSQAEMARFRETGQQKGFCNASGTNHLNTLSHRRSSSLSLTVGETREILSPVGVSAPILVRISSLGMILGEHFYMILLNAITIRTGFTRLFSYHKMTSYRSAFPLALPGAIESPTTQRHLHVGYEPPLPPSTFLPLNADYSIHEHRHETRIKDSLEPFV